MTRVRILPGLAPLVVLLSSLTACGGAGVTAEPAGKETPVTVEDCSGNEVTFSSTPQRIVALDGYAAQSLARLGVTDRLVGVGLTQPFSAEKGELRAELARIPVLDASGVPSTEVVAAQRPDLVVTAFSAFGGPAGSPTETNLATMRVRGLAACLPKPRSATQAAAPLSNLSLTYAFLLKLGKVLRIDNRAEQLVAGLRAREQAVAAKANSGVKPRVLMLADNPTAGQPIGTFGPATIANALVSVAGGENVFADATGVFASASAEEVVNRDPQVILVLTDYSFAKLRGTELVDRIRSNPILARTSAVRTGRVLTTSQYLAGFPSPLNVDALEQIQVGLSKGGT